MVLLLEVAEAEVRAVTERFREAVALAPVALANGAHLTLTASIGAASIGPRVGMQCALRRADEALYAAKRAGRNRVVQTLPAQN